MAVIRVVYRCDWPGCGRTLECTPGAHSDHDWEGRGGSPGDYPSLVVCREHRFRSTFDLLLSIEMSQRAEAAQEE